MFLFVRLYRKNNSAYGRRQITLSRVPLTANKVQIRQAVEKIFNVQVEKVATIRVLGKVKRMGRTQGKRSDYKKAIVTLKAGESIEFFEGV